MSIEGQGHFFTVYFPGFVCFVLYQAKISGERLQDHWSSGFSCIAQSCGPWCMCLHFIWPYTISFAGFYDRPVQSPRETVHRLWSL